jgi:phosphoglycolate phosphatase-like HAD superfamily hydrolase
MTERLRLANREQPDTLTMVAWNEPLPNGGGYGPRERHYVAVDALLSDEALHKAACVLGIISNATDDEVAEVLDREDWLTYSARRVVEAVLAATQRTTGGTP